MTPPSTPNVATAKVIIIDYISQSMGILTYAGEYRRFSARGIHVITAPTKVILGCFRPS